jgi:hypothetical protein
MPKLILSMLCLLTLASFRANACSACKITANGHTWFGYGDALPQGGMNEVGLAYDVLTVYKKKIENRDKKPSIGDREAF